MIGKDTNIIYIYKERGEKGGQRVQDNCRDIWREWRESDTEIESEWNSVVEYKTVRKNWDNWGDIVKDTRRERDEERSGESRVGEDDLKKGRKAGTGSDIRYSEMTWIENDTWRPAD